jgi:TolB-like protein/tetratricopeptide (TPR) repeat protein
MPHSNETSGFSQFIAEMRRRHVVRFALGYAAAAFVILQLAEIVFPAFGIGEGGLRVLVVTTGLFFPPALVLAWVYDLTTDGLRRTQLGENASNPILSKLALFALLMATVAVTGGVGVYLAEQGVFDPSVGPPDARPGPIITAAYDPATPIRSLAVLPLEDFSPNGDQAYFTSGMHEEVISRLAVLQGIRVISRTSVMQYAGTTLSMREIADELGVDVVVEGSVTRTEDRTRVRLRIVHAPSETTIETLEWDREVVDDVLAFQTEVAHMVVHEIDSEHEETMFTRTVANIEPAAQDAYFRGKYEYDRGTDDGYRMALDYFEDAIEEDPEFAPAMAGLAGARFLIGLGDPESSAEQLEQAQDEAQAALELDPTSVEALEVLGYIERTMPSMMGEDVLIPAPKLAPTVMHIMSAPGEADSIMIDVSAFDTTWVAAVTSLGAGLEERIRRREIGGPRARPEGAEFDARQLVISGRFTDATEALKEIVEADPEGAAAWEMLARAHMTSGDVENAVEAMRAWHDADPSRAPGEASVARLDEAVRLEGSDGYWAWQLDRLTELDQEGRRVPRTEIAAAHAALGNTDLAFDFLFQSLENGEPGIFTLRSDPVWDDLRADPRFRQLTRQAQLMRFSPTRRSGRGGAGTGREDARRGGGS